VKGRNAATLDFDEQGSAERGIVDGFVEMMSQY
jgi:hypothetical protein